MSDVEVTDEDRVLKHPAATRTFHWVHMITCLALGISGFAVYFQSGGLSVLFGGVKNVGTVHAWIGAVFAIGPVVYILLSFERFAGFIDTVTHFPKDDINWFKVGGGYIPGLKGEVPPQDKYNAGQKMMGLISIVGSMTMILTGMPMWLWRHDVSPAFLNVCWTIHLWAAVIFMVAVLGHGYLGAVNSKTRGEFASMMIDGYGEADWARKKNGKWFATLKCETVPDTSSCPDDTQG